MGYLGHVRNGVVVLDGPVELPEGAAVRVELAESDQEASDREWPQIPAASFAADWDNEHDAIYDQWRERYSVRER